MASITLTKHHGLGNDFLIAVSPRASIGADDAVAWCDRRRGVGADGLIVAEQLDDNPANWVMSLWNGDGSRAQLSGNGLRCLGQALVLHHDDGQPSKVFRVNTDAGVRAVEVHPDRSSDTFDVTVEMGSPKAGPLEWTKWEELGLTVHRQQGVDIGNPHLVAVVDRADEIDLATVGPVIEADYPDGINVEMIEIRSRSAISLRVWERGAGITEACGTGACAAAWAAQQWGEVDNRVTVEMPGGSAVVDTVNQSLRLRGPATFVAVVEIEQHQ